MLVLSRKKGESILIGDDIEITILDIKGDKVQLGIKADKKHTVLRKELYEEVSAANQQAQEIDPKDLKKLL